MLQNAEHAVLMHFSRIVRQDLFMTVLHAHVIQDMLGMVTLAQVGHVSFWFPNNLG